MIKFEISNTLRTVSAQYEFNAETLKEKAFLTIKSVFKIKHKKVIIKKEISNTIELNDEEIIKVFRNAHNDEEIKLVIKKKLQKK